MDLGDPDFISVGALVYIVVEVIPDAGLLRGSFQVFPRRRRIHELERIVIDNPSAGNYEELGLLYLDDGNFAQGAGLLRQGDFVEDRSSPIRFTGAAWRRSNWGTLPLRCRTWSAPSRPIRTTTSIAPRDCWPGPTRRPRQSDKADAMFREATRISTISETYYHYALFLQSQGRIVEAREWAQKILDKKPTMPGYLRRRERPWFRKASALLGRLRTQAGATA